MSYTFIGGCEGWQRVEEGGIGWRFTLEIPNRKVIKPY